MLGGFAIVMISGLLSVKRKVAPTSKLLLHPYTRFREEPGERIGVEES